MSRPLPTPSAVPADRSVTAWRAHLRTHGLVLDGGLATELEHRGVRLHPKLWSAAAPVHDAQALHDTQRAFAEAGAEVVCTATYQASIDGLGEHLGLARERALEVLTDAVAATRLAAGPALVAASVGPYGAVLADGSEYRGDYSPGQQVLSEFHAERLDLLLQGEPDLVAFETIPSRPEVDVLLELLAARPSARAWLSLSVRTADRLADGAAIDAGLLRAAEQAGVVAVGVNCLAPEDVEPALRHLGGLTDLPLVAYPNSGELWRDGRWCGEADATVARRVASWWSLGARVIGGCCRTRPQEIEQLRDVVDRLRSSA